MRKLFGILIMATGGSLASAVAFYGAALWPLSVIQAVSILTVACIAVLALAVGAYMVVAEPPLRCVSECPSNYRGWCTSMRCKLWRAE